MIGWPWYEGRSLLFNGWESFDANPVRIFYDIEFFSNYEMTRLQILNKSSTPPSRLRG